MTTGDANNAAGPLELIATAASGTEAVVKRELAALGYTARTVTPGRLLFRGDAAAICRTNLWLRAGERVLIQMGSFPATDFGVLFDGTAAIAVGAVAAAGRGVSGGGPVASIAAFERAGVPEDREDGRSSSG